MGYPLVDIIIINYNGRLLLERFLPSVANIDYPSLRYIVVDNASRDGSADFINKNYPDFQVITAHSNYGTAEGSNIGAKYAQGEYIFFISNDMELDSQILRHMITRMEDDRSIGICTCKMLRITESGNKLSIIDSVGADLDILGFPSARGINKIDDGRCDYFSEVFFFFWRGVINT